MKYLLLLILIGCGKSETTTALPNCNTDFSTIKNTWISNVTDMSYDISSCQLNETCRINTDLELFIGEGTIELDYFNIEEVILGKWQICDGVLELYDLDDGSSTETFR